MTPEDLGLAEGAGVGLLLGAWGIYRNYEQYNRATGGSFADYQVLRRDFKTPLRRQPRHNGSLLTGVALIVLYVVITVAMTWHGGLPGGAPWPLLLMGLARIVFNVHGVRHRRLPHA